MGKSTKTPAPKPKRRTKGSKGPRRAASAKPSKNREALHRLVDALPTSEIYVAQRYLAFLRDVGTEPAPRAPLDDEPETPEETAAVREAEEALARGEVVTHDPVRREFGL